MNNYVTGAVIKTLREKKKMTQSQLAQQLCVSDKTISKWETGKGFPDISLLEPLAKALQLSVPELLSVIEEEGIELSGNARPHIEIKSSGSDVTARRLLNEILLSLDLA